MEGREEGNKRWEYIKRRLRRNCNGSMNYDRGS